MKAADDKVCEAYRELLHHHEELLAIQLQVIQSEEKSITAEILLQEAKLLAQEQQMKLSDAEKKVQAMEYALAKVQNQIGSIDKGQITDTEVKQYLIDKHEIENISNASNSCEVGYCGIAAFSQRFHCTPLNQQLLFKNISAIGKLRHPNIALFYGAIFNHSTESNTVVVLTEVLPLSLHQVLEAGTYLNEKEVISIGCNIARALAYLHHKEYYLSTVCDYIAPTNVLLKCLHNSIYDAKLLIATENTLLSVNDGLVAASIHDVYQFGYLLLTMVTGSKCYPKKNTAADKKILDACSDLATPPLIALLTNCLQVGINSPTYDFQCSPSIKDILNQLQEIDYINSQFDHLHDCNSIPKVYNC